MVQIPFFSWISTNSKPKASTAMGISFFEAGWVPSISTISPGAAFRSALRASTNGTGQVSPLTSIFLFSH